MTISAARFKQKCLRLMNQVQRTHRDIVITKRGRPVARLGPIVLGKRPRLLGYMKGQIQIKGDIVSPIKARWTYDAGNF